MMRIFCKVDGRDGLIVGSGPGFRKTNKEYVPCTVLLVIMAGSEFMNTVHLDEAQLYGIPKRLRKLHKKLLRRAEGAVE